MSNYLERVAASASRKGTGARPPVSGPPLLPMSVGLSGTSQEFWQSDEPFFSETISRPPVLAEPASPGESTVPARTSAHAEDVDSPPRSLRTAPRSQVSSPLSLKNETQLTVHLPRTLRPRAVDQVAQLSSSEHPPDAHASPVSTVSTPFEPDDEPGPEYLSPRSPERAVSSASETTVPTVKPTTQSVSAGEPLEESQPQPVKQGRAEARIVRRQPDSIRAILPGAPGDFAVPAPGRDRPAGQSTPQAEPRQPALAMPLPPLRVAGANRKPEPRLSIGRLEVMVNNHPAAEPVQQRGSPPSRSAAANLERRYLDRFRLRL